MAVESDDIETPMCTTHRENINYLMKYVYEFDNNRLTDYENKPITIGDTDQQVYQGVW